ncbi:hypothetical protein HNQ60_000094 [Povalibacter uvarum]|uniref:Ice-binding protein C-terminal domain-containing protein n=1 Tax=Povalibacter uvarum TaxID=732238 RepID=A0A841HG16_9GAMM|nr:VPLPA-CTERM sorting domain-containing protein [Povalibacter uvarum]MBB6091248.1 hypothetical protein [Povalibacter uvarum]
MNVSFRRLAASVALMFGLALSIQARADFVSSGTSPFQGAPLTALMQGSGSSSLNNTQLVWGSSLSAHTLTVDTAGTVSVRLKDLGWPESLQSLQLLVTDFNGLWQTYEGSQSFSLFLAGPTRLFTAVYARSADGTMGLYNLNASFAPVPLPAAVWLLLSGMGALGFFGRRNRLAPAQ